jgi:hypothetical protein
MLTSRKMTLRPLLESENGVHLTVYLVNHRKLDDLRQQLRDAVAECHEWLNPVMSEDDKKKFLEPIEALLVDSGIFKQMKGNIGIFRNQNFFRVLNIPVDVESLCQVATSFHVKPLLRWLQTDHEYLFLGMEQKAAYLYLGNQHSLKLIDSFVYPVRIELADRHRSRPDETYSWLGSWIYQLTKNYKLKLFVAGEESIVKKMTSTLKYKNAVKTPVANHFNKDNVNELLENMKDRLKQHSQDLIEKALREFRFAEDGNRVRKNIFQISKAVVQGRVRKLIVSDELSIFGKIDKKSGGLAIHPCDLDHEDDDILDDLAQMVLSQGGEVVVISKEEIPKGRPILAILEDDGKKMKMTEDLKNFEILQERYG